MIDEARRSANAALLERFSERDDGSRLSAAEAVEALQAARIERDAGFDGLVAADDRHT